MAESVNNENLLRELRRFNLYQLEDRQLYELRSKIESRFPYPAVNSNPQQDAKFAVLFYGLAIKSLETEATSTPSTPSANKSDDSAVFISLDALSNLDLLGHTLAAEILSNKLMPLSKVKEWFNRQTQTSHIAIADRMIALGHKLHHERENFARTIISKVSDFEPEKAVCFFKENGTKKGQMTFFTLEKFMTGNYGSKCRNEFINPESLEKISYFSETVPPYPEIELVTDVALHLKSMDPLVMEKVLFAISKLAESIDQTLLKEIIPLAKSPTLSLGKAAMDIIAKFGKQKSGAAFAGLFNQAPKIRAEIINRLPRLDSDNFTKFMAKISPRFHTPVISALFSTLCEEDPHCFGQSISAMRKSFRSNPDKELSELIADSVRLDTPATPPKPPSPSGRNVSGVDFIKIGAPIVLNIEKKLMTKGFKRIFGKEIDDSDSLPDVYSDAQISNQRAHKLNRVRSLARDITFQFCSFSGSDFSASTMEKCKFVGCKFESTSFSNVILKECTFKNCTFSGCSFSKAMLYDTSIMQCSSAATHFDTATFFLCAINNNKFSATTLAGAYFFRTQIKSCTFNISDFREAVFFRGAIHGVTFKNSDFKKTLFNNTEVSNISLVNCSMGKCQAVNISTDASALLTAMRKTLNARLTERERLKKKPAGLSKFDEPSRELIYKAIKRWFAVKDIASNYEKFAENNERRASWAEEKLDAKAKDFFKILPALIHTDKFEKGLKLASAPVPAQIAGYTLSPEAASILEELFPKIEQESPSEGFIPILTILTIGSVGTIAQTPASDLDCWVCCDFSLSSAANRDLLKNKLNLIEEWAMHEFSVEVHFFLMDVQDVKDNNFGISDAESSGSAQGAILKEEFYRSALLIAGKPPLWWFTPANANDKIYQTAKKRVAALKGQNFAVDLGNVPRIPGEEFFGASLWQIVKGVKSPFKSIMKFGLLERYTSGTKAPLLCEAIKKNILEGRRDLRHIDPYMLMYQELAFFYNSQSEFKNAWLTGMALRLKCGMLEGNNTDKVPERPEEKELNEFTANISKQSAESKKQTDDSITDFKSVLNLGEQINLFMINTYKKIRKEQDRFSGVSISPEDLTKLGRKISANYTKRQFKVARLCLPGPKKHFFNNIIVSRPNAKKWILNGESLDESGSRNVITEIKSSPTLSPMLVWLVLNKLYDSSIKIKMDLSASPVRDRDIRSLFTELKKFFPPKTVFDTPIEETLKPERILKAFFIVNLSVPRETDTVKRISLVYNTNWGEVFCKPLKISPKLIKSPAAYLLSEMKEICSEKPEMKLFIPQNSECPLLNIL
ncbi:class I adenylate cyclase [Desulfovibrio gilichinskyi]|uniref:Adenylate cyclase, class 1 n=1 Tax=Desulfovibrio gilichinskyi TaxID=1519643 RepID=A0A1X7CQM0_9BACT|nr:class I adenylate cyclase [Desulfovibrio gilichinskyi]SMF01161.1 adenylate cyclase, class 1 [Desulfovibrio gilichinskyi]